MGHLRALAAGLLVVLPAAAVSAAPAAPAVTAEARPSPAGARPAPSDRTARALDLTADVRSSRAATGERRAYRRWPGSKIRFYSRMDPSFDWTIAAAMGAWNQSGVDMTFQRVRSARRAQLVIKPVAGIGIFGEATLGHNPSGGNRNNWIRLSKNALEARGSSAVLSPWQRQVVTANVLAHEMGHTLGIDHQPERGTSCGLMMATLRVDSCDTTGDQLGHYRCGMTDSWVLRRAVRLYGGRRTAGAPYCPILPLPPQPADLRISGGIEDDRPAQVDWTPPDGLAAGTTLQVRVSRGDRCPAHVGRDQHLWPVWADDTFDEYVVDPAAGTWQQPWGGYWDTQHEPRCFTARLVNEAGGSATPVSLIRTPWYPAPAAPTVVGVEHIGGDSYYVVLSEAEEDDSSLDHYVLVHPTGQCGTGPVTLEAVWSRHPTLSFRSDDPNPCIRVVSVRGQRIGPPTAWQVG
jgi:hypothetical protein